MKENNKINSIDPIEVEKFTKIADQWWDPNGKFKPLHQFNPIRIEFIKDQVIQHFNIDKEQKPLSNLSLIDIGCGGGLLSEPMARLGANVTAIDASEKNINIAKIHAKSSNLNINYQHMSAEELVKTNTKFDIVMAMEIIEHVANVEDFIKSCTKLLNDNGIIFIATLNRTIKSFLGAIIGAEYILNWLPRGTHDWKKFLRPSEITNILEQENLNIKQVQGMSLNILSNKWHLSDDTNINYVIVARK